MIVYYKLRRNLIISAKKRRGKEKKTETEKESKLEREKGSKPERELYLNKETSLFSAMLLNTVIITLFSWIRGPLS